MHTNWGRGQVGIGVLVVFIAMVLVAAIAAGTLINTASFLEQKADEASQDSAEGVTGYVQVTSATGTVDNSSISSVTLVVGQNAGASEINLSKSTVSWVGPETVKTLVYDESVGPESFTTENLRKENNSVLTESNDRIAIHINTTMVTNGVSPGERVSLQITTQYGSTTPYIFQTPESLEKDEVRLE